MVARQEKWVVTTLIIGMFVGGLLIVLNDIMPYLGHDDFNKSGIYFNLLTRDDARLQSSLNKTCDVAKKMGFKFVQPSIRIVRFPFGIYINGLNNDRSDWIFISSLTARWLSNEELEIMVAHELGHAIDTQTNRSGDNFLRSLHGLSRQDFADKFAGYIYSEERMTKLRQRYSKLF